MRLQRSIVSFAAAILLAALAWSCEDDPSAPPPDDDGNPAVGDLTPPQTVADLSLSYHPSAGDVRLEWTAPRDDDEHDRVARYDIRYTYSFPMSWWAAEQVANPPAPGVAGSPQEYVIADVTRGQDLYAAIRCFDDAGHYSEVSSVAYVRVPGYSFQATCTDAMTGAPVAGADAQIVERFSHDLVTGVDGTVSIIEASGPALALRVESGAAALTYHSLAETFALDADHSVSYPMIEYATISTPAFENMLAMLWEASGRDDVLLKWRSLPVAWYAPAFVNINDLDYYDLAARAAARWNEATGLPLFVVAGAPPAVGVQMEFLPPASMGGQNGITAYSNDAEGYPLVDRVRIVDTFSDGARLYSIMLHELGHTIRLRHLNDPSYIMFPSQPLPTDISSDEVRLVQLLTALPNPVKLGVYDRTSPP
ncbi:MAG: hypothetical protein L0Z51_02005 [Candidatus Latescibacteria bacterium]|nr:hypothetical protein [Candidatus Latescibacterota bacterium]